MKFVSVIACLLALSVQSVVARDRTVHPASKGRTAEPIHTYQEDTCGDGIVNDGSLQWSQTANPVAADAADHDELGYSVSISGRTVVAGAPFDDDRGSNSGSAYVFARNVGGVVPWGQVAKLTASDGAVSDGFGVSVSVSGDTVLVGSFRDDDTGYQSGSAYLFERNAGGINAWQEVAKLTASDAAIGGLFGYSVSISGDTAVVGALFNDHAGIASGSAYVFERNLGGAGAWGQAAKLTASDAAEGDLFGISVSIDGNTVVVGARHDDDAGSSSGSAYVFERNLPGADAWGQAAKLTASDAAAGDVFGASVAIDGDTVAVGAFGNDDLGSRSGSAYVFERNVGGAGAWGQVAKLTASDGFLDDEFGFSVAVRRDTVVVGAFRDDDGGTGSGSAYVFHRDANGANAWGQFAKLTASDPAAADRFGWSVSVDVNTIVVGASLDDGTHVDSGSVYLLTTGEECDDGAANSDTAPDACRTDCTLPGCGDDVTDSGEACDDGASNSDTLPDACRTDCAFAACGDGVTDTGEECDDGNTSGDDGCNPTCRLECGDGIQQTQEECDDGEANSDSLPDACRTDCTLPACGDDVIDSGEACDGNNSDTLPDACRTDCTFAACGDGITDTGEECDDGNTSGDDGCNPTCQFECGDGIQQTQEECDDGIANSDTHPDACRTDCTLPDCGDGVTDSGEGCDDGASNSDIIPDTCRTDCTLPACGDGVNDSGEECDDGNTDDDDQCNAACENACGDGILQSHEACDDGAGNSDTDPDACRANCTLPRCGDNVLDSGEDCDDGGANSDTVPDACRVDCTLPVCGDGVIDTGEECDDGNADAGDGCDVNCEDEYCGDGIAGNGVCGWDEIAKLTASDASPYDRLGRTSIAGDTVVVGADESAYVFERDKGGTGAWGQVAKLTAADAGDVLGRSVSVSGDTVVVVARRDDGTQYGSGSAYVFQRNAGGADAWGRVAKLTAAGDALGDWFGSSVSISGDTVVVGASLGDGAATDSGSAYVFERDAGGADAWEQVAALTAADGAPGDRFGQSVTITGDTIVVGASGDDDTGINSGSAYVFERDMGNPGAWGQVAKLIAALEVDYLGFGLSISASGDTVVGGAPRGRGSAFVFERNAGGADAWGQVARLRASDGAGNDILGISVSISGDTIVAGARLDDHSGEYDAGSAYVFGRHEGGSDAWGQVAKLTASDASYYDEFGGSVSLSGGTVVVAASGDDDAGLNAGSAYILSLRCEECDDADANSDILPDACRTDCTLPRCGDAVADSGEACDDGASNSDTAPDACRTDCTPPACGDGVTDTGEECDDGNADDGDGCNNACRNEFCGDGIQQAPEECDDGAANSDDLPDTCRSDCTLPSCGDDVTDSGEACDDGASNSDNTPDGCRTDCTSPACGDGVPDTGEECDDGNTSDGDGCSGACRNEFCGDGIVNGGCEGIPIAKAVASDAALDDFFGVSVSVSGDTAVVGAPGDDDAGSSSGSVYVFERNMGGADGWSQVAKLTASDGANDDYFGTSVSLDGDIVVVGARRDGPPGSAYVFERNAGGVGAWGQVATLTAFDAVANDQFGFSVSVSGNTVVVGAHADDDSGFYSGSAYVFERNAGGVDTWSQAAKLTASDGSDYDRFGYSVSVSGNMVVVGTRNNVSAYVFERNLGGTDAWGQAATLVAPDPDDANFGVAVSVSGDTVVVGGGDFNNFGGPDPGFAYLFERNAGGPGAWGEAAKLTASDAPADGLFGFSVSVSGDTVVVGARHDDDVGSDSGSAYVFVRDADGADTWREVAKLTASDADAYDYYGTFVSVDGDAIAVGAPGDDDAGSTSGSAYIVTLMCERCDDGNTDDGDGCSSTCQTEMIPNLIANGGFEGRVPWRFFADGTGSFSVINEEAVVAIGNAGSRTQLFQRFGGLVAGTYQLDFDVRSSVVTRATALLVNEADQSWIAQAGFRARPAWSHVTRTLVVPADAALDRATARLSFHMPGVPDGTTLHFDNVVLRRVGPD